MRSRRCFGMELDRKYGIFLMLNTFNGFIVEIHVGNTDRVILNGIHLDRKAVVFRRYIDLPCSNFLNGLVGTAMAEFQFIGFSKT